MSMRFAPRGGGPAELPVPDSDAIAHSERLHAHIREEMSRSGDAMAFDRFMERALYAPGLGYYTAGSRKFGEAGDFVTAPETSPVFARCLARQCAQFRGKLGGADLLEIGAGSGVMAADLLIELDQLDCLPQRYFILEVSPDLRQRQRDTLAQRAPTLLERVCWLEALPSDFEGVAVANELLDAMPVHRFRIERGEILEAYVEALDSGFNLVYRSASRVLVDAVEALDMACPEGYESEINLRLAPWLRALSECMARGVVLLIDYGYERRAYYHPERVTGTLMCHYRHRAHADATRLVGLQDITAHVDFTAVAEAAVAVGLEVAGYTTQAHFLMASGLDELVAQSDPADVASHFALVQGVKRLTLPSEMGERFKVMGLSKGFDQPLRGFSLRDMRDLL